MPKQALEGRPDTQSEPQQIKHKTLSAYYPSILTLRSVLHHCPAETLARPNDPEEYRSLLEGCLVASRTGVASLGEGWKEVHGTQQEAIDRVLGEVSRRDGRDNVLLFGLKASYTHAELPINTSRPAFENRYTNSPSAVLRSLPWKILRSRMGDAGFRNLLILHSLFLPVGNNCYAQLTGVPLYDLYDNPYDRPTPLKTSSGEQSKRKLGEESGRQARKRQKRAGAVGSVRTESDATSAERGGEAKAVKAGDRIVLRGKMFYGQAKKDKRGRFHPGLPPHHTLNKFQARSGGVISDTACLHLIRQIFPSMFSSSSSTDPPLPGETGIKILGSRARLPRMTGMIRELFARHAEVDYPSFVRRLVARQPKEEGNGLQPVTQASVGRFLGQVGKAMFSLGVVGSEHNRGVLLRHMRHFVEMRQHETIDLHALMQDIRIDDFSWAALPAGVRCTAAESGKRRRLVEDFVHWVSAEWLMPLLKNTFYITETAATRYETVYFLQEDWERETKPHLRKLEAQLLEELTPDEAHHVQYGPLGTSAVRLVPKPNNGFRPIVNLGKRLGAKSLAAAPAFVSGKTSTANQVLRGLHQVLTCEKDRHKEQMGNTLFGTNEVFAPLQKLKVELLDRHGTLPRLYFVKMDIKSAFDTIKQDKIIEIVEEMLDKDNDYCILMYSLLLPPASKASHATARRIWKQQAVPDDGQSTPFTKHANGFAKHLRNAVLVDLMRRRNVSKKDCMDLLRTHIQNNILEVEGKLFRQKTGIPQGSKVSSLLCSFFYAVLEREHLGFATTPCSRLLRYIDDFLFITADLALARRFVQRMQVGFPAFGAYISPGKTLLSFEYASGSQVEPICVGSDGKSYFPYCGFLIDTITLDISMDYVRVVDTHIKQSFALRFHRRKPSSFIGWFSRQLENRNQVAYLDSQHNDSHTVRMNIFLNFALTCMKVPHYFDVKLGTTLDARQAKIITESLCAAAEYTYMAGRARVHFAARLDGKREHYAMRKQEFMLIAQTAMIKVFSKKASQFKPIVHSLTARIAESRSWGAGDILEDVVSEGWAAVKDVKY